MIGNMVKCAGCHTMIRSCIAPAYCGNCHPGLKKIRETLNQIDTPIIIQKRHCCKIGCDQEAKYQIYPKEGGSCDDYTEACADHVEEMKIRSDDEVIKI